MKLFCKICDKLFLVASISSLKILSYRPNRNVLSVLILFQMGCLTSQAQPQTYLNFPAEKNNVQALPQKFEYSIRDSTKILLGNRIIDTSQFGIQIIAGHSPEIELQWPAQSFEAARLIILNQSGVAVWSQDVTDNSGRLVLSGTNALLQSLLLTSFFRFCVGRHEIHTGSEICSPELVLQGSGQQFRIKRKSDSQSSFVTLNGKPVTPHGIVFLNDEKESLAFRAVMSSGVEFRMDVKRMELGFVDVMDADEFNFIITIKGPPPVPPTPYKRMDEDHWSIPLKKERAYFYLTGEAKVPLRQEFIVHGPLPRKEHRVYVDKTSSRLTYSNSLELRGTSGRGSLQSSDGSTVVSSGKNFTWHINNVNVGPDKNVFLQVRDEDQVFTASHSVSRQPAHRIEMLLGLNSDKFHFYFGGEAQAWFESPPWFKSSFTQRLGAGLVYNQDITGDKKTLLTELDLFYRFTPGIQLLNSTWFAGLAFQNWSIDSEGLQTLSPIIGWSGPAEYWSKLFFWQELDFKYSMPKSSSSLELKQHARIRSKFYQKVQNDNMIRYSLGAYTQTLETNVKKQHAGILAEAAWVWIF